VSSTASFIAGAILPDSLKYRSKSLRTTWARPTGEYLVSGVDW